MEEKCEVAERILKNISELEQKIRELDLRFEKTVMAAGPSGYVGCSHECRGMGQRRRSGSMENIAAYLNDLGRKKDKLILLLGPAADAFETMKGTKSGHVIFYRIGRGISVQEYADKFGYSRRHARRLYIRAMADFYDMLASCGGEELIKRFTVNSSQYQQSGAISGPAESKND